MRVIWHNGNSCVTGKLNDDFTFDDFIHSAPIGIWDMSDAFSNASISDWKEMDITLWIDLK